LKTPWFADLSTGWAFEAFRPSDALYVSSASDFVGEETLKL
jgi:hypothetical protein